MPRKPRYFIPDVPVHIVQLGHSRSAAFFENEDNVNVHAFVLMMNHAHLLVSSGHVDPLSKLMQSVGRFIGAYNSKSLLLFLNLNCDNIVLKLLGVKYK